jgi:hypothetical protein
VGTALNVALSKTKHEARDGATVALAVRLAAAIDEAEPKLLGELSARLLPVLAALQMTPAARSAVVPAAPVVAGSRGKEVVPDDEPGLSPAAAGITQLRARAGARRTAAVDATSS